MTVEIDLTVLGAKLIERRLKRVITSNKTALGTALNLVAADLLQRSADLAPILTGDLIRSGRIAKTDSTPKVVVRIVGYGTNHAQFAHNQIQPAGDFGLGPISRKKPPSPDGPIGGNFLLRPYLLHKQRYINLIASSMEDAYVRILDF